MEATITFFDNISGPVFSIIVIVVSAVLIQAFLKALLQRSTSLYTRRNLFKNSRDREKRVKTLNGIISALTGISVWSIAALMILDQLGVPIGPIIASVGILGAALAFGTQSLVKDFVSGLFIIAENQYHVDDYVVIGSLSGRVESVSVRTTSIRGDDGSLNHIPNGSITALSNKSTGQLKELIKLDVAADTDLSEFAKVLTKIAEKLQKTEHHSALISDGPTIASVQNVTKNSITIMLEIKTTASKQKDAVSAVWREIAAAVKKGTIKLG